MQFSLQFFSLKLLKCNFYVFNNYTKFLTDILEKKNSTEDNQNPMEGAQNMFKQSQNSMKQYMPKLSSQSMPKLK